MKSNENIQKSMQLKGDRLIRHLKTKEKERNMYVCKGIRNWGTKMTTINVLRVISPPEPPQRSHCDCEDVSCLHLNLQPPQYVRRLQKVSLRDPAWILCLCAFCSSFWEDPIPIEE